jgi:vacuolar-type H+-ATPase subunit H
MASDSFDSILQLKKAEDDAADTTDKARKEGVLIISKAHEKASSILEDAGRQSALERIRLVDDSRAAVAKEGRELLLASTVSADRLRDTPVDTDLVAKCKKEFLGRLNV